MVGAYESMNELTSTIAEFICNPAGGRSAVDLANEFATVAALRRDAQSAKETEYYNLSMRVITQQTRRMLEVEGAFEGRRQ